MWAESCALAESEYKALVSYAVMLNLIFIAASLVYKSGLLMKMTISKDKWVSNSY